MSVLNRLSENYECSILESVGGKPMGVYQCLSEDFDGSDLQVGCREANRCDGPKEMLH